MLNNYYRNQSTNGR